MRNQETELQGQLQNRQQEKTRINARMNQNQITNNSLKAGNEELTQQLQTSNHSQA